MGQLDRTNTGRRASIEQIQRWADRIDRVRENRYRAEGDHTIDTEMDRGERERTTDVEKTRETGKAVSSLKT